MKKKEYDFRFPPQTPGHNNLPGGPPQRSVQLVPPPRRFGFEDLLIALLVVALALIVWHNLRHKAEQPVSVVPTVELPIEPWAEPTAIPSPGWVEVRP